MAINKDYKFDIFISYQGGKKDTTESSKKAAEEFYDLLKGSTNYNPYMCTKENKNDFEKSIDEGLNNSKHFILFLADVNLTEWTKYEINTFFEYVKNDSNRLMLCVVCSGVEGIIDREVIKVFNDNNITCFNSIDILSTSDSSYFESVINRLTNNDTYEANSNKNYHDYLSDVVKPDNFFSNLPISKFKKSIYFDKTNNGNSNDYNILIKKFKDVYINKRMFREIQNEDEMLVDLPGFVNDHQNILLRGDAGCGKSTLLFNLYIDLIKSLKDGKSKIIPFFLDLATINKEENINAFLMSRIKINPRYDIDGIYKVLNNKGFKILLIFDSYDECIINKDSILSKINELTTNNLLNFIDVKILIGARTLAFESRKSYFNSFEKILVKDFDFVDAKTYIDNLFENEIIDEQQRMIINKSIDIIIYNNEINPFLLSLIVGSYAYNSNTNIYYSTKVYDIIYYNVYNLCIQGRELSASSYRKETAKKNISLNDDFLNLIGISGKLKLNFKDKSIFSEYWTESDYSEYIDMVKVIIENTYLLNNDYYYYQQIFNDFYGARYIYKVWTKMNSSFKRKLMNELVSNTFNNELIGFLAIIADNDCKGQLFDTSLDSFLIDMFELANPDVVYNYIKAMIILMRRYSDVKIVKDRKPIDIKATYNYDEFIDWIYTRYFTYLVEKELIDYDYFYGILLASEKYQIIIDVVRKIKVSDHIKFKMLSIIRDSYLYLNFDGNNPVSFEFKNNSNDDFENIFKIVSLSINNKRIGDVLSLREALNLLFYLGNDSKKITIEMLNVDGDIDSNYYPSIYNIHNFITNDSYDYSNKLVLVEKKHNLLFDINKGYFTFQKLNLSGLINFITNKTKKIFIGEKVDTVLIYNTEKKLLNVPNVFLKRDNILSIDISENIKGLDSYSLNFCERLVNIILPKSLTEIGDFALYSSNRLRRLFLPNNVYKIGESIVEDCYSMTEIHMPLSLKEVGEYVFEQCNSLRKIDFNSNDIVLKDGLFKGCKSILSISDLNLYKGTKFFPKILFSECNFDYVDLSEFKSLKIIGSYCFQDCKELKTIIIPESVDEVGIAPFYGCKKLEKIIFKKVPLKISKCFLDNINFDEKTGNGLPVKIVIENIDITTNSSNEFNEFVVKNFPNIIIVPDKNINGITFEFVDNNRYICDFKFNIDDDSDLIFDSHTYDFKVFSMDKGALGNSEYYQEVKFDCNLEQLAEWAFEDCFALFNVDLKETIIKEIPSHTFTNCYSLKNVSLPSTLETIKSYAFENCRRLISINFTNGVSNDDSSITIPKTVKLIETDAFIGCEKLIAKNEKPKIYYYESTEIQPGAFPEGTNLIKKIENKSLLDYLN